MPEVKRPASKPLDARQRRAEAVPQPYHVAFVERRGMQRQWCLPGERIRPPGRRRIAANPPWICGYQRRDLPADQATNACLLANGRRIVDGDSGHARVNLTKTAERPESVDDEVPKSTTPIATAIEKL